MPVDLHRIRKGVSDSGAAQALADHTRRLRKLEGSYGVIGKAATITGPTITTADTGERVVIQGPPVGSTPQNVPGAGAGIFIINGDGDIAVVIDAVFGIVLEKASAGGLYVQDGSGTTVLSLVPGVGLTIVQGDEEFNQINWQDAGTTIASIYSTIDLSGAETHVITNRDGHIVDLNEHISTGGGDLTRFEVQINVGPTAILCDSGGNAQWPGSIGVFGTTGPGSQPASPGTATGTDAVMINKIKTILEDYGMCA